MKPLTVIILPVLAGTVVTSVLAAVVGLGLFVLVRPAAPPTPMTMVLLSIILPLLVVPVLAKVLQFVAKYNRLTRWAEKERSRKALEAETAKAAQRRAEAEEKERREEDARPAAVQESILRFYDGPELAAAAMFGNLTREYFERDETTRGAYRKLQQSLAPFTPSPQAGGHHLAAENLILLPASTPACSPSRSTGAA
jgi:hypothetical protein